ncbi:MAG TPA: PLP-dependent transferase, partial [Immundisolibacter sp.]|nr:PLP-dependent transferase [Immundisolibacter sp.]
FLGGHGVAIGGVVVDGGGFDWEKSGKFPTLTEPYAGFHGMVFSEESTTGAFLLRARREGLRDFGACMSPHTAWLMLQGIETLSLRMERHCENTQKVAEFLQSHPRVSWVSYAGLPEHPDHAQARKYLAGRASGILSFGVKGGFDAGVKFLDALQLVTRLVNIGDAKSLATHPASTTHRQLNPDELAAAGVAPDMVRLSIGIENVADILADIEQALAASVG